MKDRLTKLLFCANSCTPEGCCQRKTCLTYNTKYSLQAYCFTQVAVHLKGVVRVKEQTLHMTQDIAFKLFHASSCTP